MEDVRKSVRGKYRFDSFGTLQHQGACVTRTLRSEMIRGKGGNPGYRQLGKTQRDIGQSFLLINRANVQDFPVEALDLVNGWPNPGYRYRGDVYCDNLPVPPSIVAGDLQKYGATAYTRMKPTKPEFDLGQAVAELRELPNAVSGAFKAALRLNPKVARRNLAEFSQGNIASRTTSTGRRIGSSYLAMQFGWLPLYRDCMALLDLQARTRKKIDWLLRARDKPIRTKTKLSSESASSAWAHVGYDYGYINGLGATQLYAAQPYRYQRESRIVNRWASARWIYHWPQFIDTPYGTYPVRKALSYALSGGFVRPTTVWNLMPWTWLADYFSNFGDFIEGATGDLFDDCMLSHSIYLMEHSQIGYEVDSYFCGVPAGSNTAKWFSPAKAFVYGEIKRREKGHLWGFGLSDSDLNLSQKAILGALGLSKL